MREPLNEGELADCEAWFESGKWLNSDIDYWVPALLATITDAQQELARHHQDFDRWEEMAARGAGFIKEVKELRVAMPTLLEIVHIYIDSFAGVTLTEHEEHAIEDLRDRVKVLDELYGPPEESEETE